MINKDKHFTRCHKLIPVYLIPSPGFQLWFALSLLLNASTSYVLL